ncbi:MAG: hypothetical protein ACO3XN_10465 [Chthoniobacterales bacterium]
MVIRHQLMQGGLVGDIPRDDRAGDLGGAGALVVLLAVDVPDFDEVAELLEEEVVAAVDVEVDAL